MISEAAMKSPDAVAIVDGARSFSYSRIATLVEQHSAALDAVGVEPGDRVGVHFNKCAEGFIAMHAVVSAGAIAVPLDPSSPTKRLARICADMSIDVVISHGPRERGLSELAQLHHLRATLGTGSIEGVDESMSAEGIATLVPYSPESVSPDQWAYIITTSGSTGEPKGIVHSHSSGRAYADTAIDTYGITSADRIADISPHHFDISTLSLWGTPLAGARNVIVNEAYQRLPASHSQLLEDEQVTLWYSVPFLLQQLIVRGDLENRNLDKLRWVHFGGEVMPVDTITSLMAHCPNARFANIFGPAEVNQCSLAVFDTPADLGQSVSIGLPLDHTDIRLIDPDRDSPDEGGTVATGEVGEMWVATPQLMCGYWNTPEVNDQVIQLCDGRRYYRTGDLASLDGSGAMTFHGRVDHQVKVRGFRIELEGIESDLESIVLGDRSAENVVAGVLRHDSGEDEIVAGMLGATIEFDSEKFLASAASILPSYAVPKRTVALPEALFTSSGKLDRRRLREEATARAKELS